MTGVMVVFVDELVVVAVVDRGLVDYCCGKYHNSHKQVHATLL